MEGNEHVPKRRKGKAVRRSTRLFHWDDTPEYLRDNEFILNHYRADTGLWGSLKSLFRIHNESGNVWTHLLGLGFFVGLLVCIVRTPPTPLALKSDDIEGLWQVVTSNVNSTTSSLMQQLAVLQTAMAAHADPLHAVKLLQRPRSGRSLREALQDSLLSMEHGAAQLSQSLTEQLQALSHGIAQPSLLLASLSNMTAALPHNVSEGVVLLRTAFSYFDAQPTNITLQLQSRAMELWHSTEAALQQLSGSSAGTHGPPASDSSALDEWLGRTVRHSVMWPVPRWPFYLFMGGAMACLFCSAFCHLLACCSRHVGTRIWRLDYAGIVANIVSSFYPAIYYIFLCQPTARLTYLCTITALGSATLALSTLSRFQHAKWRTTRALCFAFLGLFGVLPWGHVLLFHPYTESVRRALVLDASMGASYLLAAAFFSTRIPEKWYPGRFDLWLNSHQIFHIFVVLGCYLHYLACLELVTWRDASGGCALELTKAALVRQAVDDRGAMLDVEALVAALQERMRWLYQGQHTAALQDALLADGVDLGLRPQCVRQGGA